MMNLKTITVAVNLLIVVGLYGFTMVYLYTKGFTWTSLWLLVVLLFSAVRICLGKYIIEFKAKAKKLEQPEQQEPPIE